jgi:hypothetical protein
MTFTPDSRITIFSHYAAVLVRTFRTASSLGRLDLHICMIFPSRFHSLRVQTYFGSEIMKDDTVEFRYELNKEQNKKSNIKLHCTIVTFSTLRQRQSTYTTHRHELLSCPNPHHHLSLLVFISNVLCLFSNFPGL